MLFIFHCLIILSIMALVRFRELKRYLHIINLVITHLEREAVDYNKIKQVRG